MLFYADRQQRLDPIEVTSRVVEAVARGADSYRRWGRSPYRWALEFHPELVGAAVAFGELHQAVADRLNPVRDDVSPELDAFVSAAILLGRCVYRSSRLVGLDRACSDTGGPALPLLPASPPPTVGVATTSTPRQWGSEAPVGPSGPRGAGIPDVNRGLVPRRPAGDGFDDVGRGLVPRRPGPRDGLEDVGQGLVPCRPVPQKLPGAGETPALPGAACSEFVELLSATARAVAEAGRVAGREPIEARVPEGYAFYSLYPEMYLASAHKALRSLSRLRSFTVLGIRSIGASLAPIVAGALLERGLAARVETLRPRGHPFDRYVELGPALAERLSGDAGAGAGFLVVDEGPGLTCSSFLSVCSALDRLGVEQENVALLSAWRGAPSIYASEENRQRWKRVRLFHSDAAEALDGWRGLLPFVEAALRAPDATRVGSDLSVCPPRGGVHAGEQAAPPPPKPAESPGAASAAPNGRDGGTHPVIQDLSYGRWRERCYPSVDKWPTVHRPAERTKLLIDFPSPGSLSILAKFAGLGEYGRQKQQRAAILADAGFSPPVAGLAYGFLLYRFLDDARPLAASDLSAALLERMVDYYAFVAGRFPAPPAPRFDSLAQLLSVNVPEALGADASPFLEAWQPLRQGIDRLPLTLVDGRPQPHEWLRVGNGEPPVFLKADGADHFRDHTLVGEQSILWDLAGCCEEWEMDAAARGSLLELWKRKTGDGEAALLLDFYRAAYLAFRVAALHYAIHGTDEEEIRRSLQHQQWGYKERLSGLLTG